MLFCLLRWDLEGAHRAGCSLAAQATASPAACVFLPSIALAVIGSLVRLRLLLALWWVLLTVLSVIARCGVSPHITEAFPALDLLLLARVHIYHNVEPRPQFGLILALPLGAQHCSEYATKSDHAPSGPIMWRTFRSCSARFNCGQLRGASIASRACQHATDVACH